VENLTSHVDLLPTLLGLAGIAPEPIRQTLAQDHPTPSRWGPRPPLLLASAQRR
jgi:arylsulfatase A-like enzyme